MMHVSATGCFDGGKRNPKYQNELDTLSRRQMWAPMIRNRTQMGHLCQSNEPLFCTALTFEEAERFGPQYIALQKCNNNTNGAYTVDAIATCAVLVIGAGGLGSPLLMYLAAAGIGIIGIMDGDVVEISNLHRQIVHDEENKGKNKALSAKQRLTKINSQGVYIAYDKFFGKHEAENILPQYDLIVDATDNPQTRYLINDACVKFNKTLIIASSIGTQGQIMVFNRHKELEKPPCYRCIAPMEGNPFIDVKRGACSLAGVLGTLPGILGCIQATEVLKIAAGANDAVLGHGRMLIYDTMNVTRPFRCIKLKRNVDCTACGDHAKDIQLQMLPWQTCSVNYQVDDTAISNEAFRSIYMDNIRNGIPVRAKVRLQGQTLQHDPKAEEHTVYLVDVRAKEHYTLSHLAGAINWTLATIMDDIALLRNAGHAGGGCQQMHNMLAKRCNIQKNEERIVMLFICFLGNSSRIATDAVKGAIKDYGTTQDRQRFKCFSIAGGCRAIRTKLGIEMPLS